MLKDENSVIQLPWYGTSCPLRESLDCKLFQQIHGAVKADAPIAWHVQLPHLQQQLHHVYIVLAHSQCKCWQPATMLLNATISSVG